jgi:hypothetical protein
MLVFSTGFVNCGPFNLISGNKYRVQYTRIQCVRGGSGSQTDKKPAAKSLYRSNFLDNDILHCSLSV